MIHNTVMALCYQIGKQKNPSRSPSTFNKEANFVLLQMENMPDYLRLPFRWVTLFFGLHTILFYGRPFYRLAPAKRQKVILSWKNSFLSPLRDFIRFHESLVTVSVYSN